MNPCTPHSTVNPDLHARWLSWLDPDAVKSAAGGRLLDERHIDVKTKQARVLVERYFDPDFEPDRRAGSRSPWCSGSNRKPVRA